MSHRNGMGPVDSEDPLKGQMLIYISKMDYEFKYGEKYKVVGVDRKNFLLLVERDMNFPPIWCYMMNFISIDEYRDLKINKIFESNE